MGGSASTEVANSSGGKCCTEVKVTKFNFSWLIKNYVFSQKTPGQCFQSTTFQTADKGNSQWCLVLYPKGDEIMNANYASLFLKLIYSREYEVSTEFTLSLLDRNRRAANTISFRRTFKKGSDQHGEPRYVNSPSRQDLLKAALRDDVVEIICQLNVIDAETSIEEKNPPALEIPPCRLSEDMENLFTSNELTDVKIRCKGKEFLCHKAILAARSPVFLGMFKHDMRENEENQVFIRDMGDDVLEALLRFMYTEKTPSKELLTKDLLVAADKYDLQRLKLLCEDALASEVSEKSAVGLLTFADKHNADKLKLRVLQFIVKNANRLTASEDWKELVYEHPNLMMDLSKCLPSGNA